MDACMHAHALSSYMFSLLHALIHSLHHSLYIFIPAMQARGDELEENTTPSKKPRVVESNVDIEKLSLIPEHMCVSSQASHASALPTGRGEGGWRGGEAGLALTWQGCSITDVFGVSGVACTVGAYDVVATTLIRKQKTNRCTSTDTCSTRFIVVVVVATKVGCPGEACDRWGAGVHHG
jgi:hypothetical protein